MDLTQFKSLTCVDDICTLNGVEFQGNIDVCDMICEHEITGNVAKHSHTIESAIDLSVRIMQRNVCLQNTLDELNRANTENKDLKVDANKWFGYAMNQKGWW